ncbi:MAG: transporter [wastewater metagenome]|nr:transporter [Candidatus Loosdrechtia aerotolerans]
MQILNLRFGYIVPFLVFFFLFSIHDVRASHGPGTGGATTVPAITLKKEAFSLGLRTEWTEFESISRSRILEKAEQSGSHFDAVDRTFLHTAELGYGVTDDLTLGLIIGWFESINFREAESDHDHAHDHGHDEAGILRGDPDGITDLWLFGKYRFYRGPQGHWAVLAGIKFPTGEEDKENSAGEKIEPGDQPGSGSYDFLAGLAYSRWLTKEWTLDTNIQYIFRTEGSRDFKVGDRMDWNLAMAYQIIPRNTYPNIAPVGEINVRYLFRDEENGRDEPNSGGTTVFLSPGIRLGITPHLNAGALVSFPVFQNLLGEQLETDFKVTVTVGYNF